MGSEMCIRDSFNTAHVFCIFREFSYGVYGRDEFIHKEIVYEM